MTTTKNASTLRERRLAKGLTIAALSAATGISIRSLVRHEANATTPAYEAQRRALETTLGQVPARVSKPLRSTKNNVKSGGK